MSWMFPRESLRTNGSGKSRAEERSESSKRGLVGDQTTVVVQKWSEEMKDRSGRKGRRLTTL